MASEALTHIDDGSANEMFRAALTPTDDAAFHVTVMCGC
jgi:hypothetical protein